MRYLLSVTVALGLGAAVGGALGFAIQQLTGQDGWALVVGSLGANGGAFWAALRRADRAAFWQAPSRFNRSQAGGDQSSNQSARS
jgi:hypothetical protein